MLACVLAFYGVPALQYVLPADFGMMLYLIASVVNLLVISLSCIILTIREGFKWYYPIIVAFLYFPSLLIFYDSSMFGNIVVYLGLAYVCQGMGHIVGKIIERNR